MSRSRSIPQLAVRLDGSRLEPEAATALAEVRVQQRLSMPALCELVFVDAPEEASASRLPPEPGAALEVDVEGETESLFRGEVTAVEHVYEASRGRQLRVRAYDRLHRLRKRQAVRAHVDVSAESLARELVADLGLAVEAPEPGPRWSRIIQYRQSDLDLLADVAQRTGLYFTLRSDVLHLLSLEGMASDRVLELGHRLLEARIERNGDRTCREVVATGWSAAHARSHEVSVRHARTSRAAKGEVEPQGVGATGRWTLVDEPGPEEPQAEALAQAELDRRAASEVVLWGVAEGDPRLQPGTAVRVEGVAPALCSTYVLTSVDHRIDGRRGFLTELSTAPPSPPVSPRAAVAVLGEVTGTDDPEGLGRVQVALPAYGGVESSWMAVLCAGAGGGKGLVALPEAGDHVLVLLVREDPAEGVVLGGLYGMEAPPDARGGDGRARPYTLLTPGGQRVRLDDRDGLVRVENEAGSYVELSSKRMRVHAATDLVIEAPGRSVAIRGRAIDFQEA